MSDQARLLPDVPTAAEADARERDHEVDRTPRGLVRAALARLVAYEWSTFHGRMCVPVCGTSVWDQGQGQPLRILDVCAGAGVWSSEARRLFGQLGIPVEITAVEIRAEERERLRKWADHVVIGDIHETELLPLDSLGPFDLAIGNPHFTGLHDMLPELLGLARAVVLLHTTQAFQRGARGQRLVHAHPPALELRVGQSVKFRSGVNPANGKAWAADSLCYSVSAWVGEREPGSPWLTQGLPLEASARKWVEIPGAEVRIGEVLPTAPGWAP